MIGFNNDQETTRSQLRRELFGLPVRAAIECLENKSWRKNYLSWFLNPNTLPLIRVRFRWR